MLAIDSFSLSFFFFIFSSTNISGQLWIAEVRSRFGEESGGIDRFTNAIQSIGFKLNKSPNTNNKMFVLMEFTKIHSPKEGETKEEESKLGKKRPRDRDDENDGVSSKKLKHSHLVNSAPSYASGVSSIANITGGEPLLKPCVYKKR